ncbi:MAG: hypothetical protein KGN36_08495 [Acidobacteriota bacterium]|nr:hypothetical protein [Acidobacteriota bacterium]
MLNRGVVSVCASLAALVSLFFVGKTAVWTVRGQLDSPGTVFMLGGWLLAAAIFAWRAADPEYLDPLSIIKRR